MDEIIGTSSPIKRLKELIKQVSDTGLSVLITGESGVGKELVARSLHRYSPRRHKPFIKVNCAALPNELLESELFGYEKGAFTGATEAKPGKFELADRGTMFLDEIGDMSIGLQAKLLQVLQDSEFCRVGGIKDKKVDVWIVCATNHDLEADIQKGSFREDLYYRINIIKIEVPPLRDRKEDIPLLIKHFLKKYINALNRDIAKITISDDLMNLFIQHNWPGNVRELENYIQKIIVMGNDEGVKQELQAKKDLQAKSGSKVVQQDFSREEDLINSVIGGIQNDFPDSFPSLKQVKKLAQSKAERIFIEEALRRTGGNKRDAAVLLKISYKAILYKIKEYGITSFKDDYVKDGISVTVVQK